MNTPTPARGQPEHAALGESGPFAVNQEHELEGPLRQAIDLFEAAASRFATDAIRDARLRQIYMSNIQRISREVRAEVDAGRVSVVDGAKFCQRMRNQIMAETRAVSSAQGRAYAESLKEEGRTLEWLLDKHARTLFRRPFSELSDSERAKAYYSVVESAGRDSVRVSTLTQRLRVIGKVGLLVTAIFGVHAVAVADDKPREVLRQGAAIGGGMAGGALAGAVLAAPVCGPGAVVCAVAVVLLGSVAGSLAAEQLEQTAEEELEEFARWNLR